MQVKTVNLKTTSGEQVYPVAYPWVGLSKEVIVIDGIEMTQEELTSAFEDLKTYLYNLTDDENPLDWNTVDREYIFKNVLGQDIRTLFECLDSEVMWRLLGCPEYQIMEDSSVINYISMQGYDIKKGTGEDTGSISFAARDSEEHYTSATPTCCTILLLADPDTEAGGSIVCVKGIPQIVTEGHIRFKKCPALSEYKSANPIT